MAEIVKPNMNSAWASGGAIIAPSNTKIQQGWTSEIPPHQWQNWWQNRVDMMLLYLSQKGIPEWDSTVEYWANRSFVQRSGNLYKAVRNNINADPLTSSADWTRAIPSATTSVEGTVIRATSAEVIAGTNATKYITPATLESRLSSTTVGYLKASNNLSDLQNVTQARQNLGIRAASSSEAGLLRIATANESTARTSDAVALSPAGLNRNIQSSLTDTTARRLLTVGSFGLGASVTTPPNGRSAVNPAGMYYQAATPSFGGGNIFLEVPYSSTVGGFRLSTTYNSNRYFLNGWDSGALNFRPAVEIYHSGNFNPNDKQNALGFVPVNRAGDAMTGNLRAPNFNADSAVNVGNAQASGVFASIEPQGLWVGNSHQRWRWYMEVNSGAYSLGMYTAGGAWINWALQVQQNRRVSFAGRPFAEGRDIAYKDEVNGLGDIGTYAFLGTQAGTLEPGWTAAGTSLTWANASRSATGGSVGYGTWRCCGRAEALGGANDDARASLFLRVS